MDTLVSVFVVVHLFYSYFCYNPQRKFEQGKKVRHVDLLAVGSHWESFHSVSNCEPQRLLQVSQFKIVRGQSEDSLSPLLIT